MTEEKRGDGAVVRVGKEREQKKKEQTWRSAAEKQVEGEKN